MYKNIHIYYIGYTITNNVKLLHLVINNANGYIEQSNGNNYLTLFLTDESRDRLKIYEKLWSKINDFIVRSTNNNSDDYDEKCTKIKFSSSDDLPLKKKKNCLI